MQNQHLRVDGRGLISLPAAPRRPAIDDLHRQARIEIEVLTRQALAQVERRFCRDLAEVLKC